MIETFELLHMPFLLGESIAECRPEMLRLSNVLLCHFGLTVQWVFPLNDASGVHLANYRQTGCQAKRAANQLKTYKL